VPTIKLFGSLIANWDTHAADIQFTAWMWH